MIGPEARIKKLGLELPPGFPPAGVYRHAVRTGDLLILGGHVPITTKPEIITGKLGVDLDVEAGRSAARWAGLSALTTIRAELGSLDRVEQVVSLRGVVNASADFTEHTQVIDGASEVLVEVFGERGEHARLAVGVSSLPVNLALEIELMVEVSRA